MLGNATDIPLTAFFDRLHGLFRPDMGLTVEADAEAHLAVTAFHAKENYGNRGALRKENVNLQFNKRKAAPMEAITKQKGYADLKSEFKKMRVAIAAGLLFSLAPKTLRLATLSCLYKLCPCFPGPYPVWGLHDISTLLTACRAKSIETLTWS